MAVIRVRHAEPEDAAALAEMNRLINCSPVTNQQMAGSLRRGSDAEIILVAEVQGQLVGCACIQIQQSALFPEPWAELTELYVDPEHRSRGVGSALLEQAEKVGSGSRRQPDAGANRRPERGWEEDVCETRLFCSPTSATGEGSEEDRHLIPLGVVFSVRQEMFPLRSGRKALR